MIADADWIPIQHGFPVLKAVMNIEYGYGGVPREKTLRPSEEESKEWHKLLKSAVEFEKAVDPTQYCMQRYMEMRCPRKGGSVYGGQSSSLHQSSLLFSITSAA